MWSGWHLGVQGHWGTWQAGDMGWQDLIKFNKSSTKTNTNSCTWHGVTPWNSMGWGLTSCKAALHKKTLGGPDGHQASNVLSQKQKPITSWAALARLLPAGPGKWLFPSACHLSDHIWGTVSSFQPFTIKTLTNWSKATAGYQYDLWTEPYVIWGEAENLLCSVSRAEV